MRLLAEQMAAASGLGQELAIDEQRCYSESRIVTASKLRTDRYGFDAVTRR